MASSNQKSRVGVFSALPPAHHFPRRSTSSMSVLCFLSLLGLRSTSAFQLQTVQLNCRTNQIPSTVLWSNNDPTTEISEMGEKSTTSDSVGFGESVPLRKPSEQVTGTDNGVTNLFSEGSESSINEVEILKQNKMRNIAVAVASFAFAFFNYGWQFAHPVTAVEVLASMEKQSAPLSAIGNNGKPTVIDFWAPWCSNCKVAAPTLQAVEHEYGDSVNFIMVNADVGGNWPLIQYFGVDAIPHLAFVSAEGDVETALIGPMSRNVLKADIDALLNKQEDCGKAVEVVKVCHDDLPYKMYDAFGNRPDSRRVNFEQK